MNDVFEKHEILYLWNKILSMIRNKLDKEGGTIPIGAIMEWPSNTIPMGYLLCDGSEVSRTDYAALFEAIGTTYGAGNGSTTFNLPNIKGRITVGRDTGQSEFDTLGETGGAKTHTLALSETPAITGSIVMHNGAVATNIHNVSGAFSAGTVATKYFVQGAGSTGASSVGSINFNNGGGGGAHNNLQPYIVLNYIIRAVDAVSTSLTIGDITVDNDSSMTANSDLRIPTQKAVKTYTDTKLSKSGGTMTGAITTPNNAVGINIGDDARIADRNIANTMFVEGQQNTDRGYINFSQTSGNALGAVNGGNLTWRGNQVWDAAALPYETGTWSPGISGDGNWTAASIESSSGKYTRVGSIVHLTGRVRVSAKNGMTGSVVFTNFPFTAAANSAGVIGITTTGSLYTGTLHLDSSLNYAYALKYSQAKLNANDISDNFTFFGFEITYHIA